MTVRALTQLFVTEIEAAGGDTTWVLAIIAQARAAIESGGGSIMGALTTTSVNGKSFQRAEHLSCVEVLQAARAAIAEVAEEDTEVVATRPDFRGLEY